MFGTFIGSTSGVSVLYDFRLDETLLRRRWPRPISLSPDPFSFTLTSTVDYLSTETFKFHVESTVWDYWKEHLPYNVLLFCSSNQAQTSVQTMCTMFSRKDFFRLFGGLLRISTRKTNAEPRCLTSLDSHNGAILCSETPRIGPRTSPGKPLYGFD